MLTNLWLLAMGAALGVSGHQVWDDRKEWRQMYQDWRYGGHD